MDLKEYIKTLVREVVTEEDDEACSCQHDVNEEKSNTHKIKLILNDITLKRFKNTPTFTNLLYPNQISSLKIGDNILTVNNTVWSTLQRMASPGGYEVEKIINEESASGDAGAYLTPKAFAPKKKGIKESIDKAIQKELVNEVSYSKFKNEVKFRTKNEQLHKAIREVKRKLTEIDRIVEYTQRMKQELSEGEEGIKYWKNTEKNIAAISEMVNHLNNKIKNLHQ